MSCKYDKILEHGHLSGLYLLSMINQRLPSIITLAHERVTSVGLEYNDASYDKSISELEQDIMEELADALFYASLIIGNRLTKKNEEVLRG